MNCQESREQIFELLDSATPEHPEEELAQHLATCPDCTAFLAAQEALDTQLMAAFPALQPPAGLRPRLLREVRRQRRSRIFGLIPELALLGSCAAATIVCVALLPFPRVLVAEIGIAFTAVTYLLETMVMASLEELDEANMGV